MQLTDDSALLRDYVQNNSEDAFAALVTKHVNLVYSVAMRSGVNPAAAEEITQVVFIILARKARQLRNDKALSSWLFQTTRLTANNFLRIEMRRHRREREAHDMQTILNEPEPELWSRIAPILDNAVAALNEKDRRAILLRFYEGKNLREIGTVLGASEAATEKRVSRAVEKLQKFFFKRGINSTTAILAGTISANSISIAPATLAKIVSVASATKGATASASTLTLVKGTMKIMTWLKMKFAVNVGASLLLATGVATVAVSQINDDNKSSRPDVKNNGAKPVSYSNTERNISVISDQALTNALQTLSEQLKKPISDRDQQLQKSFLQFPLLAPVINSNGQPAFQTLALKNSVEFAGKRYYGFRFTVPSRKNDEDFVWAFVQPETIASWYILPQTGDMIGFQDYSYWAKNAYPSADALLPLNGRRLILQSLPGDNLENDKTYLIWFTFNQKNPARMSVAFTFTNLKNDKLNDMENVMALNRHHYLQQPLSQPIINPDNHHIYILLRPGTWEESEAEAVNLGGHLATVRNQAEEDWIFKTFGNYKGMQ